MKTMVRAEISIDGRAFPLGDGPDIEALKQRIENAVHTGGAFVDFPVAGDHAVSALITAFTRVAFTVEAVEFDPSDPGDVELAYADPREII